MSCFYSPEQNGIAKRRHRNIHELGLKMLVQSGMPKKFWVEAFSTVVFLINRTPSRILGNESPFFKLHGGHPNYHCLHVFGSKCFPYIWINKTTKFDP